MHEDGRGCIFRGKVVLRHPLRNSGSKPYHLSTKTGELHIASDIELTLKEYVDE